MNLTTIIFFIYTSLILYALLVLNEIGTAIICMVIGSIMIAIHEYGSDEMKNKFRDFYD